MSVLIETSAGDLVFDLLTEEAPKTTLNFLKLCKAKYFNFSPLYNLQVPSVIQGGDPNYPVGDGGSSCWGLGDATRKYFKPEISSRQHERGHISMVCSNQGICGSQFFISLDRNESFDKKHAIFGILAEGLETLDIIAAQPVDADFRPLRDIRIKHTIVLEDPFEDPEGFIGAPPESPRPTPKQLSTVRIEFDESLDVQGSVEDLETLKRRRDAEANALTLETIGDLPFANIRPPENILFVCKLNPVTTSADLDLIFGRFGKILSCQVVQDKRTGDSLQYAFIEYDVKADAEMAYFKMQGVLIDDRRIHVDFSQSVAKTGGESRKPSFAPSLQSRAKWLGDADAISDHSRMVFEDELDKRPVRSHDRSHRSSESYRRSSHSDRRGRYRHEDGEDKPYRRHREERKRSRSRTPDRHRSHRLR